MVQVEWVLKKFIWIFYEIYGFCVVSIVSDYGDEIEVMVEEIGKCVRVYRDDCQKMNFFKFNKVEDMVEFICFNEVFVFYNLKDCYFLGLIYVSIWELFFIC